ncbi:hypothetical protein FM102_01140 [Corynebacterium glutamicum]|nr:hypothetical protein FM102_01140 [Corynebacterium glutamicum]
MTVRATGLEHVSAILVTPLFDSPAQSIIDRLGQNGLFVFVPDK